MKPFFQVKPVARVHAHAAELAPLGSETVPLDQALGRTLGQDFTAPQDLPGFTRSTMDGYAVRARDTFGASETSPGYLEIAGEVTMGQAARVSVGPGTCARIFTGGMLPPGADAVMMVEHTRLLDQGNLEITKAVAPGAHLLGPSDDAAAGQVMLPAGRRLRPADLGLLAGLGAAQVTVRRRPVVGIISTGDEVVPVEDQPAPGQVRDVNSHTLAALAGEAGGRPLAYGLIPDQREALAAAVARASAECDLVLLSGGSSVGTRDLTAEVFTAQPDSRLLVHGVAVKPGKPFILVRAAGRYLMGLPGQVASCVVAYYVLVEPFIEALLGRPALPFTRFPRRRARLTRNLASVPGREEYVRARLVQGPEGPLAEPVFGQSGLISTLVQGQGLVPIPAEAEGVYAGEAVEMLLFP